MEEAIYRGVGLSRIPRDKYPEYPEEGMGRYIIFQEEYSLFARDNETETTLTIASSDDPGIVYGQTVSRNEFGINAGWYVSPDSAKVAFYRKDQSRVSKFPLLDITTRTGSLREIYYPMNGMASEHISVGIYSFKSGETTWLNVTDFSPERYISNLAWSPDSKYIYAQVVDRPQHQMHLNQYKAMDGSFVRTILTESNDAWIELHKRPHRCFHLPYRQPQRLQESVSGRYPGRNPPPANRKRRRGISGQ